MQDRTETSRQVSAGRNMSNRDVLAAFELHMMTAKASEITIMHRLRVVGILGEALPGRLLEATSDDLVRYQHGFSTLAAASGNIYTRHIQAFYRWAVEAELMDTDPAARMVKIKVNPGLPHPIDPDDLRLLLALATYPLRTAYVLAAFAGLRRAEICKLKGEDLRLDQSQPLALIHGKGGRDRMVPLLPPVADELRGLGFPRSGHVLLRSDGEPYQSDGFSSRSSEFMKDVRIHSTLHSLRHYFATEVVTLTKDILLVRDLLGHASVATTQVYMKSSIAGATDRLAAFSGSAAGLTGNASTASILAKPAPRRSSPKSRR